MFEQTDFSISGELELTLEYEEPETLIATVHQAQNIKAANSLSNSSDAYIKCAVTGMAGHEETKVLCLSTVSFAVTVIFKY